MPANADAILDQPLLPFSKNPADMWTIRNACEGTQIFGGTGSGKTSGSGRAIALSFLKNGFGGLVLTAKPEELAENWAKYVKQAGRESDLVVFDSSSPFLFNFLDYEFNRPDDRGDGKHLTHNVVSLFLATLSTGEAAVSNADPFWNDALRELLTHAIDLAHLGGGSVQLPELAAIIRSAPQSRAEIQSPTWQKGRCYQLLLAANEKAPTIRKEHPGRFNDLEETAAYWLNDFPNLSEKTRSIVVSSFTGKVAGLLRDPLRRMFCEGITTDRVRPSETHKGKIIVLNLPVKEYGEVGRFAQIIYKTIWQRATERRNEKAAGARPVFLWADESQYFVTAEDMLFQQTARSKMAATVYLTQNLPNYYAALGSRHGNAATDSLLGNLQTKIFHANGDPATNEWAERVFGYFLSPLTTPSSGPGGPSTGTQFSQEPIVRGSRFTMLRKGGGALHERDTMANHVEGIIFAGGRKWHDQNAARTALGFYANQNTGIVAPRDKPLNPRIGVHDARA